MKQAFVIAIWPTSLVAAPVDAQRIAITPNGSRPSTRGPVQNFTGSVLIDPLFSATEHTRATKRPRLRLARLFDTTPAFWLNLQLAWDLRQAMDSKEAAQIGRIRALRTKHTAPA